ncbi:hypothetical protein GGR01_001951 [Acetobacter oeni]|nr:hypothetical protein [Acetobacter oeni]
MNDRLFPPFGEDAPYLMQQCGKDSCDGWIAGDGYRTS